MRMTPENWDRAKELFEAALDLEPSHRTVFLLENCDDESLRKQVRKLLIDYQEAGTFLDDPILGAKVPAANWFSKNRAEESVPAAPDSGELATATSSAGDPMIGRQFGDYMLLRQVGQGGMAVVYLAARADDEFRKHVAVKVVQPALGSHDLLSRFRNERQTLAGLDHPNIVKLLDGGTTPEGLPFLVMDYVEGCPIDVYCDQRKLCVDDRLRLFSIVCEAVQYAHGKGVVHRDLKPGNILVTADGTPKLLDFGIAKVFSTEPCPLIPIATQTGTRCMTPAYASPEQIRGKSVTAATDIYSLGVVLYELLSGHCPYRLLQHTPAEMEQAICHQDPDTPSTAVYRVETGTSADGVPITRTPEPVSQTREGRPETLRRRLRGDLDTIALKALQKEPERRYDSVEAFSQDIRRHLQHLPVKARRNSLTYRASKFVQRYRAQIVVPSIVLLLLAAGALLTAKRFRDLEDKFSQRGEQLRGASPANPNGWMALGGLTATSAAPCENLGALSIPNTKITLAQKVPGGAFTLPNNYLVQSLPGFCRVEGLIEPSDDSEIRFAVWMPLVGWNRRFRGVGNSGFAGEIEFADMASALRSGYATASTDTGHTGGQSDPVWAIRHPEKVADFGYRAVHEMTEKAKVVIRSFYGQAPQWSFFEGSSNGGREGLIEAQRYPEDYQGILVGVPPISGTHLLAAALYNTFAEPPAYIPSSKIPAISAAVLAACDALDGVSDGILNDPRQCHFDPSILRCHGAESDSCLTPSQVAQLRKIYGGLRNSKGVELFPGYLPGGEEGDYGWEAWITGDGPGRGGMRAIALNYFRDMVFENPGWDFRTVSAERATEIADIKTGRFNATDPDLRRFKAKGGKLILYHGWSDAAVPATEVINYYDRVATTMGEEETKSFVRLYIAPGMHHGFLGPGPNYFGQADLSNLGGRAGVAMPMDPQHNISTALVQWTEKGIAPDAIIATKYINDLDPTQGIKMTRPLCPYPQIAKYKGAGDTNEAANFACAELNDQHSRALVPQSSAIKAELASK
jgi:feruloyl esterase